MFFGLSPGPHCLPGTNQSCVHGRHTTAAGVHGRWLCRGGCPGGVGARRPLHQLGCTAACSCGFQCQREGCWGPAITGKDNGNLKTVRLWQDAALCARKLWNNLSHLKLTCPVARGDPLESHDDLQLVLPAYIGDTEKLNLGNNGMEDVTECLGLSLGNLRVLVLLRNRLVQLPPELAELGHDLMELYMSCNWLTVLGAQVVSALS